ncbi:MAG: phosphonate metabolism protein/1,5-bisphosphokinase (PRPP-forming) PhnN [Pseudomonadota bacterium]
MSGTLILIVGPSGVGKDTLLAGARDKLESNTYFRFARRHITRPKEAGGEDHEPVSLRAFNAAESAGSYPLSWRAHQLSYGIHKDELKPLLEGRSVVVNASRSILDKARRKFENVAIVSITAPEPLLRARLQARARETAAEIENRIARAGEFQPKGDDVFELSNNGAIDEGVLNLSALLVRLDALYRMDTRA